MSAAADYVRKQIEIEELSAKIKQLEKEMVELEPALVTQMQEDETETLSACGRTIYVVRHVFASIAGGKEVFQDVQAKIEDIINSGEASSDELMAAETLSKLFKSELSVNTNSLRSWFKEMFDPDGDRSEEEIKAAIPESMREMFNVSTGSQFRMRKQNSKTPKGE